MVAFFSGTVIDFRPVTASMSSENICDATFTTIEAFSGTYSFTGPEPSYQHMPVAVAVWLIHKSNNVSRQ
jgi:hypothetical protein